MTLVCCQCKSIGERSRDRVNTSCLLYVREFWTAIQICYLFLLVYIRSSYLGLPISFSIRQEV